jgi:hypothetical protein
MCGHPEGVPGVGFNEPPAPIRYLCACGVNNICSRCGFGSMVHPHSCDVPAAPPATHGGDGRC